MWRLQKHMAVTLVQQASPRSAKRARRVLSERQWQEHEAAEHPAAALAWISNDSVLISITFPASVTSVDNNAFLIAVL